MRGGGAVFVDDDVLTATGDDEATGPAQDPEGDLVGHDPGGHEEGGRLAHPLGVGLFQGVDRGVFAVLVVAHLGLGHGPAHLRRGLGDGVAAEIDEARRHGAGCYRSPYGASPRAAAAGPRRPAGARGRRARDPRAA